MNVEMPNISSSNYASSVYFGDALPDGCTITTTGVAPRRVQAGGAMVKGWKPPAPGLDGLDGPRGEKGDAGIAGTSYEDKSMAPRICKVFIADINENIPLENRILYKGDEKLTDLTDQEMYFEIGIGELLAKHNEMRKQTVDKQQSEKFGRNIYLEAARIRDLRMVVVTIAQF